MWIYLNDRFVPDNEAVVSVYDHGFLYGDGIYETLRAYHGRVLHLSEHLRRLERSAARLQLHLPRTAERLAELIREALQRNRLDEAYVRITVSRGPGEIGLDPTLCKTPTLVILARAFRPYPERLYADGVSMVIARTRRNLPEALPPQVKSLNFLNNILAKMEANAAGVYEAVMLNHAGELTEATTSNLFLVRQGCLYTPALDCGILDGITRGMVLQLARESGIPSEETHMPVELLYMADECFLTNTTQELMPVTRVDGRMVGDGKPGPITRGLHASFRDGLDRFLDGV
jgi:branched-chain amino acid aminotransferase